MDNKVDIEQNKQQVLDSSLLSKRFHLPKIYLVLIIVILAGAFLVTIEYYLGLLNGIRSTRYTNNQPKITARTTSHIKITDEVKTPTITPDTSSWQMFTDTTKNAAFDYPNSFFTHHWSSYSGDDWSNNTDTLQSDTLRLNYTTQFLASEWAKQLPQDRLLSGRVLPPISNPPQGSVQYKSGNLAAKIKLFNINTNNASGVVFLMIYQPDSTSIDGALAANSTKYEYQAYWISGNNGYMLTLDSLNYPLLYRSYDMFKKIVASFKYTSQ